MNNLALAELPEVVGNAEIEVQTLYISIAVSVPFLSILIVPHESLSIPSSIPPSIPPLIPQ